MRGGSVEKPASSLDLVSPLIDPLKGKEGTVFDKPAPTGPPQPVTRSIPPHYKKLVSFYEGIIADEGLIMDLCVDRAVGIIEFNYKKRAFGSDMFQENPTPLHFIAMAGPLAVELYKQVILSIGQQPDVYEKLLQEAKEELERGQRKTPSILTP